MRYRNIIYLSFLLLSGCYQDNETSALKTELNDARVQVNELQDKLDKLEKHVEENQNKYALDQLLAGLDGIAYLTPGSDGYSVVSFDLGKLTVSLNDIQPYANGSKVILRFGNPLATTINGLNMTVDWGQVNQKGDVIDDTTKSKSVTLNESLYPARWTTVSLVLDGITPSQLGFVRLKELHHSGISLSRG